MSNIPAGTYLCKVKHVQLSRSKLGTPTMDLELEVVGSATKGVKGKKVALRHKLGNEWTFKVKKESNEDS